MMSQWSREIETLNPQVDYERICFLPHACVYYYRALAEGTGIKDVPDDFTAFETFHHDYEAAHFRYASTNAEIGCVTRDLLLSMYLPRQLVPLGRPAVHALCDPPLRSAMGFDTPSSWIEKLVITGLGIRAGILRLLPSRRRPRLLTRRRRPTYPTGYRISELGTFP